MRYIQREQLVPLPVGEAFAFFADAFNRRGLGGSSAGSSPAQRLSRGRRRPPGIAKA